MFHWTDLQEKNSTSPQPWGSDKIENSHKRAVTAVLLKPRKFSVSKVPSKAAPRCLLSNLTWTPKLCCWFLGWSATCCWFRSRSDFSGQTMPNRSLMTSQASAQCLGPTGLIFAMRSRYNNQSGSETFFDEVDTAFSGQDAGLISPTAWLMLQLVGTTGFNLALTLVLWITSNSRSIFCWSGYAYRRRRSTWRYWKQCFQPDGIRIRKSPLLRSPEHWRKSTP